jgi:hypothetical protein
LTLATSGIIVIKLLKRFRGRMATAVATSLSSEVASRLLRVPHVQQVFVRREADMCYVWTVVDDFSAATA